MKYFIGFMAGVATFVMIATTFETDVNCHYIRQEREVLMFERPNIDGMTTRTAYEIYVYHIFRGVISNEVIWATNEVNSHRAILKTEPVDPRLRTQ